MTDNTLRDQYAEAIRIGLHEWAAMDIEGTRGVRKWDFLAIGVVAVRDEELAQVKRGGKALGEVVVFLADLIKDAYLRGADDPIAALQMLGNHLAEVLEGEGGLPADEHNRVYRALEAHRSDEEGRLREGNERRRTEVSRSLADIAHAQRPLADHERTFQDGA